MMPAIWPRILVFDTFVADSSRANPWLETEQQ